MKTEISPYDAQLNNPLLGFLANQPRGSKIKEALLSELITPPGEVERSRSPETRLRYLSTLRRLHIPLNRDVALWELLLDLWEDSYASRCPTPQRALYEMSVLASFPSGRFAGENDIEAIGIALIGMSGVGKSRTLKRLLRRIIQVIPLPVAENPLLPALMITWLRVECPANRSLISLANAIIRAIEKATKERIPANLKTGNQSDLALKIAELCSHYKVGLLMIDEIQHVLDKKGKPAEELLNFLVELSNELDLPLVIVGTPRAHKTLGKAMRMARRGLGPDWENLKRESDMWKEFSSKLLSYHFTKEVASYDEIEPVLYDLSQGLPSLAVMLWRLSQRYALLMEMDGSDIKCVTTDIMAAAYADYFNSVRPMVDALRSGDPELIELYEDLRFDKETLEEQLSADAASEAEAARMELFKARRNAVTKAKRIIKTAVMAKAEAISRIEIPEQDAEHSLLDAFDKAKEGGEDPAAAVAAV